MDKKKKILIGVFFAISIIIALFAIIYNNDGSHPIKGCSTESHPIHGGFEIKANNVLKDTGAGLHITVEEGERLVIESSLEKGEMEVNLTLDDGSDKSNLSVTELMQMVSGTNSDIKQVVKGHNTYKFDVPAGRYNGMYMITKNRTTGKVVIKTETISN